MSASAVTPETAFDAAEAFEKLCWALTTPGFLTRLRQAALEALGRDWAARYFATDDRWVIEHRGGRVRVEVLDAEIIVHECDRFDFEVATYRFGGKSRAAYAPRALRFASQLAVEVL